MLDETRTVDVEGRQLKADITVRSRHPGISMIADDSCTFCGRRRHEVAMLITTLYADSLEVTIRVCGRCLADAGVGDILPGGEA